MKRIAWLDLVACCGLVLLFSSMVFATELRACKCVSTHCDSITTPQCLTCDCCREGANGAWVCKCCDSVAVFNCASPPSGWTCEVTSPFEPSRGA